MSPLPVATAYLRGVDVDLRRLDTNPDAVTAVEPELAHRGRCHLGDDRRQAREPHADAIALEVEVDGSTFPDIPRSAVGTCPIEGDGARMHDGKHIAVRSARRRQRSALGEGDHVVAGAAPD